MLKNVDGTKTLESRLWFPPLCLYWCDCLCGGEQHEELYSYNSAVRSYVGDYVYIPLPFFLFPSQ